jgi:hypothetical protein
MRIQRRGDFLPAANFGNVGFVDVHFKSRWNACPRSWRFRARKSTTRGDGRNHLRPEHLFENDDTGEGARMVQLSTACCATPIRASEAATLLPSEHNLALRLSTAVVALSSASCVWNPLAGAGSARRSKILSS